MKENLTLDQAILEKVQRLPPTRKAEVLNFVNALAARRKGSTISFGVYAYTAGLVKKKRLKRMSLREIDAIVHEVRGLQR